MMSEFAGTLGGYRWPEGIGRPKGAAKALIPVGPLSQREQSPSLVALAPRRATGRDCAGSCWRRGWARRHPRIHEHARDADAVRAVLQQLLNPLDHDGPAADAAVQARRISATSSSDSSGTAEALQRR